MKTAHLELDLTLPLERFELAVGLRARGPVLGVFGPSGAGKSSLLEVIAGLRRRARGTLSFAGETWLDSDAGRYLAPERRHVGYVPQEGLLFPHRSVRGNLLAGRRARRDGSGPGLTAVVELLELAPLLERAPATLSGGERQRVALGRALCSAPRLLLLDEPLASLDLPLRRRLLPFLRRVRDELALPMLLVSHDPIEVQALCDEVVVLRRGRVVAHGATREVLTDPEIFPLAEREGFENVLPGSLVTLPAGGRALRLAAGIELVVAATPELADGDAFLGLPAHDVLLATEPPRGLSARNVVAATVEACRPLGDRALVLARLHPALPAVAVEVMAETPDALGLAPGRSVYLVVKATSCRVYGSRAGGAAASPDPPQNASR